MTAFPGRGAGVVGPRRRRRRGVVSVALPGVSIPYSLVVAVVAGGHYEVTMSALVPSMKSSQRLLGQLISTLKTRIDDGGGSAAL